MWQRELMHAPYALHDVEVTAPLRPIHLAPHEGGAHLLLRHRQRPVGVVWLSRAEHGDAVEVDVLAGLVESAALEATAATAVRDALLGHPAPAPTPPLTIAVCTRNRPALLRRSLAALVSMRERRRGQGPEVDLLVVDNAPDDRATERIARATQGVRYELEPVPGLDVARNRAIAATDRSWLAYVDDDAVVDPGWLDALADAVRASPDAGAFTGPIMPLQLDTEAHLRFERAGGFGKGFQWQRFGPERWGDAKHPAGPGRFGTGACMVFATAALRELGGFDEALDTGPPLPGGGDIDMFYRVLRAGRRIVYAPGLLVRHQHRPDMAGLRRQYHSWGLGNMVVVRKHMRTDPASGPRHLRQARWWSWSVLQRLLLAMAGRGPHPPDLVLAELLGGLTGLAGAYGRSRRRMAGRRHEYAA